MAHRTGINGPSVALVFSASPFNGPVEFWRLTRLLACEDRILLAALWQNVPVISCPHCGQEADDPKAALFDSISMARLTCQHCRQESLVVDDVPITEEQYRRGNIVQ
jgi:hypothetical protein